MTFRFLRHCGALALVLSMAAATVAQAQAQSQPTPAALNAARQLVELKGAKPMFDAILPGVIETVKNNFLRTSPQLSQALNEVAGELNRTLASRRQQPLDQVARAFAERFSVRELQDAIAFYKTPLGAKLIEWEARTLEEGLDRAQTWANQLAEEVLNLMRAEMKKRGHSI